MTPYPYTIRLADTDAAGRAYFASVCRIAHEAFEAYMDQIDLGLHHLLAECDWGLPVVRAEADFRHELRLGFRVTVSTAVIATGTTSITFRHTIALEDGSVAATITLTHVAVSRATGAAIPLPPALDSLANSA